MTTSICLDNPAQIITAVPKPPSISKKNSTPANLAANQEQKDLADIDLLSMSGEAAMPLNHNVRLYFDLDQTGQAHNLFSFYTEYEEYLEQNNYMDPDYYDNQKDKKAADQKQPADGKASVNAAGGGTADGKPNTAMDGEDISGPEDFSEGTGNIGGHRFGNLIKSMLARLELNNSLAPIQEYGRHQKIANKKKKDNNAKKKAADGEGNGSGQDNATTADHGAHPPILTGGEKAYDDKFYDLDDDWIDDDNVEIADEMGTDLMLAESSHFMSDANSMAPESALTSKNLNQEEKEYRIAQRLEKKEQDKIARRFRVLTAQDFDHLFSKSSTGDAAGHNNEIIQTSVNGKEALATSQNTNKDGAANLKSNQGTNAQNSNSTAATNAISNKKKRTHEEAFNKVEEPTIENLLQILKTRVLEGETLNNFKREVGQLVELIEKKDPQMEKLADAVGIKLAGILQKPQQEMIYMLKRHHLLGKRNSQKNTIDKHFNIIKGHFDMQLKRLNRKSESDFLDLKDLKADLKFEVGADVKPVVNHFKKMVQDFVNLNNEYVKIKINEEKAKAKKPKMNDEKLETALQSKYEKITYDQEMGRLVKEFSKGLSESVALVFEQKYLNRVCGVTSSQQEDGLPKAGCIWNKIALFPNQSTGGQRRSQQQSGSHSQQQIK